MRLISTLVSLFVVVQAALSVPTSKIRNETFTEPDPASAVSVQLNGVTYVNKGLVAFGLIPSNFIESTGDTLGGIGSAIALKPYSFKQNSNGDFSGTLITQPDRGFNVDGTVNYQARQHAIDFVLSPYYDDANLSFTAAQETLQLTYKSTLLYTERNKVQTSGLDPQDVRAAEFGFPGVPSADPPMPIASSSLPHLTVDNEGLVVNLDGTFWTSDEYGPYIYLFSARGDLLQTIQPPEAILPMVDGALNFSAENDPDTGRSANQGFECLTIDATGTTLYAMLQSATIQDGGDDKTTSRHTRLFAFDISYRLVNRPALTGEWVVPLPQSSKGKTLAASEIAYVSDGVFLVLARDGDGHGGSDNHSKYKQADLIDIRGATNVAGSKFDSHKNPIANNGKLNKSITPAVYQSFVDFVDDVQLARFGLHNDDPADQTLIDAKWESLALAPVEDPANPDDFFLFTAADNDFLSEEGISLGEPFNAGLDVDNQFLVFRVTLPGRW